MKHATGTCLIVIVEKGLFFAYTCIFKKIFAPGSKDFLNFFLGINILKEETFTEEPLKYDKIH